MTPTEWVCLSEMLIFSAPSESPDELAAAKKQGSARVFQKPDNHLKSVQFSSRQNGVRALDETSAMGWYKVTMITREYRAKGKALENSFESQREYHGSRDGAALFLRRDEKSDTWEYYFT